MITASDSSGTYCFLIMTVRCLTISGSRSVPSASLAQMALATSCSIDKMKGSIASLGAMSLENRGARLAVKWEMVRRAEDIRMPTESFSAMSGTSGKMTVLQIVQFTGPTELRSTDAPNARLGKGRNTKFLVQDFHIWKLCMKICNL